MSAADKDLRDDERFCRKAQGIDRFRDKRRNDMLINAILERKNAAAGGGFTGKSAVTVLTVALAVALPQIVHADAGAPGCVQWLPM